MKKYIGVKIVAAEAAVKMDGKVYPLSGPLPASSESSDFGYQVTYPDGYVSFSPKAVFEKAYLETTGTDNKVCSDDVDRFITSIEAFDLDNKTTVVKAVLKNGFILTESSSCVDPKNYDREIGIGICTKKIKDQVWFLLGFLLQSGLNGFQAAEK